MAATSPQARAAIPSGNLLVNGNAESGTCSSDGNTVESIPGWSSTSNFTVVCYGASGFPGTDVSASIGGGGGFFAGGPSGSPNSATQTIDVSSASTEIDAGAVQANLSGLLGGYETQGDSMTVVATFLDGSSQPLGSPLQIGPVTAADRNNVTSLLQRTAAAEVPAGTRSILVAMTATRTDGSYNDGYADGVALSLAGQSTASPVAVTTGQAWLNGFTWGSERFGGSIDPGSHTVDCFLEFGPTTAYGSKIQVCAGYDKPMQWTQSSPTAAVSSLSPGKLYHYRLIAVDTTSGAEVDGADATFIAPGAAVTYGRPTVSTNSVALNAELLIGPLPPLQLGTTYPNWWFNLSPSAANQVNFVTPNPSTGCLSTCAVSSTITGLQPGSSYSYALRYYGGPLNQPPLADEAHAFPSATFTTLAISLPTSGTVLGNAVTLAANCLTSHKCTGTIALYSGGVLGGKTLRARAARAGARKLVARGGYAMDVHGKRVIRLRLTQTGRRIFRTGRTVTVIPVIVQKLVRHHLSTVGPRITLRRR